VTSQGSAYGRFRRALDTGNATIELAAAAELDSVSLPDALELVLLLLDEPGRFRRAALRWHSRYCADVPTSGSRRRKPYSPAWLAWRVDGRKPTRARSPSSSIGAGLSGRVQR